MDFRRLLQEERRRARQQQQSPPKDEVARAEYAEEGVKPNPSDGEWMQSPLSPWAPRPVLDLEKFRKGPIPSVYYVPEWISEPEEAAILERIYSAPGGSSAWVPLRGRRLQMWGGEVRSPFRPEPLPQWLEQIAQALVDAAIFPPERKPNHALINEYAVGDGILPHEDGPSYWPLVAIVSVGNPSRVTFEPHRKSTQKPAAADLLSFTLERRSLLLFTGQAYTHFLHSIDHVELGTRLSLTVRHVDLA